MATTPDSDGFLSRWSRRKVQAERGDLPPAEAQQAVVVPTPTPTAATAPTTAPLPIATGHVPPPAAAAEAPPAPPPPTLAEAQRLTPADDFSRFVARGVDRQVRNTALKTLFSDPHFNVMDGLDTYIDDYNKADPLPPGMLRQMAQAVSLGLFDDETEEAPPLVTASATAPPDTLDTPPDEDTDLRLQPHDDAGCTSHQPGAEQDPRRQP